MEEKVIIYTTPDCPFCRAAKENFRTKGTECEEIDVSENPEAEEKVLKLAGKRVVPVIVEGDKVTIGFNGV